MVKKNKKSTMFDVFFREKPALMLLALKNSQTPLYASLLAKEVDCTYSHVVKILQEMQKSDIVKFKKNGRLKILELTEKGTKIANNIEIIKSTLRA